jgi:hypothetical protein
MDDWIRYFRISGMVRLSMYELYVRYTLTSYLYFCRTTAALGQGHGFSAKVEMPRRLESLMSQIETC